MDMNLEGTFKIQASTLPYILKGRNIIAQAQAGSGKVRLYLHHSCAVNVSGCIVVLTICKSFCSFYV